MLTLESSLDSKCRADPWPKLAGVNTLVFNTKIHLAIVDF